MKNIYLKKKKKKDRKKKEKERIPLLRIDLMASEA